MQRQDLFTSESVSEGHPDKVADQISDAILDEILRQDPQGRVACETLVKTGMAIIAGEISTKCYADMPEIVRRTIKEIGYDSSDVGFDWETCAVLTAIDKQSPDIAMGVDTEGKKEQGAGDQGMMFGYATTATPELMPSPIVFSHRLLDELQAIRKRGEIAYLRPDSKAQVSVAHAQGKPVAITAVVISHQTDDVALETIRTDLIDVARRVLDPTGLLNGDTEFFINPTGKFVIGGPHGDAGLTGRKIIVDTYGGVGSHGGGAFSGKDPSKVDRSAAYYSRYAAKNIVAAGLADKCEIQVAYAIGVAKPLSINVDTYGTAHIDEARITALLNAGEIFDFRPAALITELDLTTPSGWSYEQTARYGHFGRPEFPWERTDKVEALKAAAGL